jgi:glycogen(starch) synthase
VLRNGNHGNQKVKKMKNTPPSTVSIVINTLNRANLLKNTLSSFEYLDNQNFEVIVVNGPSTDDTEELLKKWEGKIKIGHCPEANLSMSRNIGIAMASGDVVAFIDDDALPEAEWLDQILEGYYSAEVAAAGGKVFNHTGYDYQYQYANADRLGHGKWQMTAPSPHYNYPCAYEFPYLQGTNTSFRRTALLEVGGFDEEFIYYLDETEVCLRLVDRGYVINQLNNAYVHHKYAPSHIRTQSAAVYRYPVLKSKVYFSNRHGKTFHSQIEIDEDNDRFMQNHRNDVLHCIEKGILTTNDLIKYEEHAAQATKVGKDASLLPQKLITQNLLEKHGTPFKRFVPLKTQGPQQTIVLLCEDYPPDLLGGIARFTQDKASELAKMGHKVHVIARSNSHSTVDFEEGVWVHRIAVDHRALSPAAIHLEVPQSHWDQSACFLDEIDRISTHTKVKIVEAPIWNITGIATLISGRYSLITSLQTTLKLSLPSRTDLTENAMTMRNFVEPVVNLEKYLIENSTKILSISKGISEEVELAYNIKIRKERLFISHLGMPDWRGLVPRNTNKDNNAVSILFVGRLEKRKGIDVLLKAIPSIVKKFPNAKFNIVGDDSIPNNTSSTYRKEFETTHKSLCGTNVFFHGKVDESTLRNHYSECDIFVAPSRFESFGLIYVEAMMFGKPVIGCNAGGIPEVVSDNETGLLALPGDEPSLTSALVKLLEHPEHRVLLGTKGRQRYESHFSAQKMAASSAELYQSLASK